MVHQALSAQLAIKVLVLDESIQAVAFEEGQRALHHGDMYRFQGLMMWLDELATDEEFHQIARWFNC